MTRHHVGTVHLPQQRAAHGGTRRTVAGTGGSAQRAAQRRAPERSDVNDRSDVNGNGEPAGLKGGFRFNLSDGSWWWSVGMYTLHGIHPERLPWVAPTTRLLLSHLHPADREALANAWQHLLTDGALVAFRYRIVGEDGFIRPVFTMASADDASRPRIVTGVMQLDEPSTRESTPENR